MFASPSYFELSGFTTTMMNIVAFKFVVCTLMCSKSLMLEYLLYLMCCCCEIFYIVITSLFSFNFLLVLGNCFCRFKVYICKNMSIVLNITKILAFIAFFLLGFNY